MTKPPRVFGPKRTLKEDIETIRAWMRENCRHEFGEWRKYGTTARYHAHCTHCETWAEIDRSGGVLKATGYPRRPCPGTRP